MVGETATWRISATVPERSVGAFEACLEPFCVAMSRFIQGEGPNWRIEGDCINAPDPDDLQGALIYAAGISGVPVPDIACVAVPGRDWVIETQRAFPPLAVGRYFIHGSHFKGRPPVGRIAIKLDAGAAFGSGQHASTSGCLLAMDRIAHRRRPRRILDVGCGSGILAIAAAKTWTRQVVAVDNDPIAVQVARENAANNRVAGHVLLGVGDGYDAPVVRTCANYDLVFANILARPLRRMARGLKRRLAPGGYAVLAGFIDRDWRSVLAAHEELGLRLVGRISRDGWSTLIVRR